MMNQPFFSICIPTYNRAHMLPAALDSALTQTGSDYEIVVVDNASTDNTQEVLRRYNDPRIRIIRNAETVNMYANHNICVENAKASWIVFVHSDESMSSNALSIFAKEIARNPDAGIIFPYCDRPVLQHLSSRPWFGGIVYYPYTVALTLNGNGPPSVVCYRKAALSQVGMFPTEEKKLYWGDLQASALIALECFPFAFASSPIEHRPIGPHRASYSLEKTAAPEKTMYYVMQTLRLHTKWNEAIQALKNDIPYWPKERAARILRIMSLSGLSQEYRQLRAALKCRKDVLSCWDSKLAGISYRISPLLAINVVGFFRKIRG